MSTIPPARLSLKDLAARLGYDQATVAQLIKEGKGPGIKVGGRYLIYEAWVDGWLAHEPGFWDRAIAGASEPESTLVDSPFIRRIA